MTCFQCVEAEGYLLSIFYILTPQRHIEDVLEI